MNRKVKFKWLYDHACVWQQNNLIFFSAVFYRFFFFSFLIVFALFYCFSSYIYVYLVSQATVACLLCHISLIIDCYCWCSASDIPLFSFRFFFFLVLFSPRSCHFHRWKWLCMCIHERFYHRLFVGFSISFFVFAILLRLFSSSTL